MKGIEEAFLLQLDELIEQVMSNNVTVKKADGTIVEIVNHTSNNLILRYPNGDEKTIKLYQENFCFFDRYKIDSSDIMSQYTTARQKFDEEIKVAKEKAAALDAAAKKSVEAVAVTTVKVKSKTVTTRVGELVTDFNEEMFKDFIKNQVSPTTGRLYAEGTATNYNYEIRRLLDGGLTYNQLLIDIDKYIFDYTNEAGSMKKYNDENHGKPSAALVILKRYAEYMKNPTKVIAFYGSNKSNKYGCFSNFYPTEFVLEGRKFKYTEQYIMWSKAIIFNDLVTAEMILKNNNPVTIKGLGRRVKPFVKEVWDEECLKVAYDGILAKFSQNEDIKKILLDTGDALIAEATSRDKIWAIGLDVNDPRVNNPTQWQGKNILGRTLMKVRTTLRQQISDVESDEESAR